MEIRPLGDGLGARVLGLDLARPLEAETFERIEAALDRYLLLSVPEQALEPPQQIAFSARFGPLDIHVLKQYNHPEYPEVFILSNETENGRPLGLSDGGSYWHSDFAFRERPAYVTMLHGRRIPASGGDTLFADMYAAFDALSGELRQAIAGRRAIQRYRKRSDDLGKGTKVEMTAEQRAAAPDVTHPLVRAHPKSGRLGLFAPIGTTAEIEGLPRDESDGILAELFAHMLEARFVTRYRWTQGDLVFWDNRWTQHKATSDELPAGSARTMFRTTAMGEAPIQGGDA